MTDTSKGNRIVSGLLFLSSFAALVLFRFSSSPPGVDGTRYAVLLNAGRISEAQTLVARAEYHAQFSQYWQLGLWGVLALSALLSVLAVRQTFFKKTQ